MPIRSVPFIPKPWRAISGSLFDVIPPDSPEEKGEPTDEDWQWYENLLDETSRLLMFIFSNVRRNYVKYYGVSFDRKTTRILMEICGRVANVLGEGASANYVNKQAGRCVKQLGLVVYSTEPGMRHRWPMPGRRHLSLKEARQLADEALHGRWPDQIQEVP